MPDTASTPDRSHATQAPRPSRTPGHPTPLADRRVGTAAAAPPRPSRHVDARGRPEGRTERALGASLPVVLALGVFCVAFVHVHDVAAWAGQPDWASWLIAVSVELMALASIIEIRHRRRTGAATTWPVTTLLAGVGMSGAANLTAAGPHALTGSPGPWTPTMALWPVAAFGLVAGLKATRPTHPAVAAGGTSRPAHPPAGPDRSADDPYRSADDPDRYDRSGRSGAAGPAAPALADDLVAVGRDVAADLARRGRPVTRTALVRGVRARGYRCSTDRSRLLLAAVRPVLDRPHPPSSGAAA
jgi:hypothetical protein